MKLFLTTCLTVGALLTAEAPAFAEDHSAHIASAAGGLKRSEKPLRLAAVSVLRQDGRRLGFEQALDDGRPVMLNFVYTSCTAICPVTAQVFAEVRERLGKDRDAVHAVTVSIDPEYDTPQRMAEYARRFGGGGSWSFFTGTLADSVAIQRSFGAYQGDKMNHVPVTFVRAAPGQPWIRLDGFASPKVLVDTLRPMLVAAAPARKSSIR
ncbi:MAG: SCO family protein [Rubrivivax sp.]|nr:SCO family protein [Rubrivivax sp.]